MIKRPPTTPKNPLSNVSYASTLASNTFFMKTFIFILLTVSFYGCSTKQDTSQNSDINILEISDSNLQTNSASIDTSINESEEIVRSSTKYDSRIAKGLQELSDSSIFSISHDRSISTLDSIHQIYFTKKPEYKLLFYSSGDLFHNSRKDFVFIIYEELSNLISVTVYNDLTKDYSTLYQDLKVEIGINSDNCNYYSYGTLDYQIASELIWLKESFIKRPKSFSDYSMCNISSLSNNPDIVIEHGCISDIYAQDNLIGSLCLATSLVYNNWECMMYDKEKNAFIIFYGQAFAD